MSKIRDLVLKLRRNYNIFYALNFLLIIVPFLRLDGFGVTHPGGVIDCVTIGIFAIIM